MSKTTRKLGKPTMTIKSTIDAHPKPTEEQVRQQRWLNQVAQVLYKGRHYVNLNDKERTQLHVLLKDSESAGYERLRQKGLV
jgi:hypothetical protein